MKSLTNLLIIIIFLFGIFLKINKSPFLFNYDSWDHNYLTKYGEAEELYNSSVTLGDGTFSKYPSLLRTGIYLFSKFSSITTYQMYRYGVIFLRGVYFIFFYFLIKLISKDKLNFNKVVALIFLSFMSSSYFIWRSYIVFPENVSLILNLILILFFELFLKQKKVKDKLFCSFFISIIISLSAYTHPVAFYYTMIIYFSYLTSFILKKTNLNYMFLIGVFLLILIFPILTNLSNKLILTLFGNLGTSSSYGSIAASMPQYTPPKLSAYFYYLGIPSLLIGFVGFLILIKIKNYPYIILYLISFGLTLTNYFKLFLPTDRMMGYFLFASSITSYYGFCLIIKLINKKKHIYYLIFINLFLIFLINYYKVEPWVALTESEIKLYYFFKNNTGYIKNKKIYFEDIKYQYYDFLKPDNIVLNIKNADLLISLNLHNKKFITQFDDLKLYELE